MDVEKVLVSGGVEVRRKEGQVSKKEDANASRRQVGRGDK
jgi:hypothetical protein